MMNAESLSYPHIGGMYYHYKGGRYKVITMAEHTETKEKLVIYQSIEFGSTHARPLSEWNKPTEVDNPIRPGLKLIRFLSI